MSGLLNSSLNGSVSNTPESTGWLFSSSFSGQSGAGSPVYHHSGSVQGLHILHGNFNVPNMVGTLGSRNSNVNSIPSNGLQQAAKNFSSGRFASNNIPVGVSQLTHSSSHGHSGMTNRGGMGVVGNQGYANNTNSLGGAVPGMIASSVAIGNRANSPGLGVSPVLGNAGSRITSSLESIVGGGNLDRSLSSGGGLSMSGLSRLNLSGSSGAGNLNVQGQNRLMGSLLQQASPQVLSMLGNAYQRAGGLLSQNHVHSMSNLNSMGMLNELNSNDGAPFDINDFPQLTSHPSSSGSPQGPLGSLRKHNLSPILQNQEFSIQNEDFPALPGYKGGNADYSMEMHQKEQHHDSSVSMTHQHFPLGRSASLNLGSPYSPNRPQQQHYMSGNGSGGPFSNVKDQDLLHSNYPAHSGIVSRTLNSPGPVSGIGSYDQLLHKNPYQNQTQFRLQQMSPVGSSYRDQRMKLMQNAQSPPDPFGLLGLLSVIRMSDPDLTSLALGIDLTTLGLNLNSTENLHRTFGSPWSDESAKGDSDFTVPQCYYAKQPPSLSQAHFSKFQLDTLFYIFYSVPKDEAQLYAANELHNRGWFYHRELRLWLMRVTNMEPLVKTNAYERGSYICFDPNTWETIRKDNLVIHYEMLEKRPQLTQH